MINGLHHVVLYCSDTSASKAWYEAAGFRYLHGYDGMHWFAFGEAQLMLHPVERSVAGQRPTVHAAVSDVEAAFEAVSHAGLQPFDHQQPGVRLTAPVTRPWGDREFELADPDGQVWAFTQTSATTDDA